MLVQNNMPQFSFSFVSPFPSFSSETSQQFLVSQKKELRLHQEDVAVLALQNQLYLVEQQAAHLVAQEIANDPPKALMAVITPKNVGGFSGGRRRQPGEEGGGAPCPSEFLLQREKRTTNPNGPIRQHPSQDRQQHQGEEEEKEDQDEHTDEE
jgi:hypothetical protein